MSLCLWDLFVSSYWRMSPAILPDSQNPESPRQTCLSMHHGEAIAALKGSLLRPLSSSQSALPRQPSLGVGVILCFNI